MRKGWLALLLVVAAAAACGGPGVGGDGGTTPTGTTAPPTSGTSTPTPSGTHTATPTPSPSGSPTPIQTLPPGVPSYAGWVANVKNLGASGGCLGCHGGLNLTFMVSSTETNPDTLKLAWFTHLCNYNNTEKEGVQSYGTTPTGETLLYYCNQSNSANQAAPNHPGGTVPASFCAAVTNWLKTGTSTVTPPLCAKNYDLANSQ